jgi:hypothetical protein
MSLSFGVSNGNKPVSKTITVTVTDLSGADRTLDVSGGSSHLTFPTTVHVEDGTATFDVTLNARGAHTVEGDLVLEGDGEEFLVPFYYSTGN